MILAAKNTRNTEAKVIMPAQVSNSLSPEDETGNFWRYIGKPWGNKKIASEPIAQSYKEVSLETSMETKRKLSINFVETFTPKKLNKNFQSIDDFFVHAKEHGLELLSDDKRWIRTICFGISQSTLNELLIDYTTYWQSFADSELIQHKKQNIGRRAANGWLREQLITRHRRNNVKIS